MLSLLRSPRLRALALLVQVAALFCQLSEGTGREHCPHHDLPAATTAMAHGAGHEQHQQHGASHACTCLGDCASSLAVLPAADAAALPNARLAYRLVSAVACHSFTPALQFRLPPALGPPHSA
jgi:hypothetical protein